MGTPTSKAPLPLEIKVKMRAGADEGSFGYVVGNPGTQHGKGTAEGRQPLGAAANHAWEEALRETLLLLMWPLSEHGECLGRGDVQGRIWETL